MQRIIQYLLVAIKLQIEAEYQNRHQSQHTNQQNIQEATTPLLTAPTNSTLLSDSTTITPQKICHADKCWRNLCSGCLLESTGKRKTTTVESEILEMNTPNHILSPIFNHLTEPISIKELLQHLQHLPTMIHNKRDDSIFGVIRYIANSLDIRLTNATVCSIVESMSLVPAMRRKMVPGNLFYAGVSIQKLIK